MNFYRMPDRNFLKKLTVGYKLTKSIRPQISVYIYLSPPDSDAEFYNVLGKLLDIASSKYNEIIVVGDFNVDLLTSSHQARKLSNLFRDNGMHQKPIYNTKIIN